MCCDDDVVGESLFTRCDDVDVVGSDGVILAVAAVGDFEAGSSLTGHEPGKGDGQRASPLTRELLAK